MRTPQEIYKQALPAIAAFSENRKIQYRGYNSQECWRDYAPSKVGAIPNLGSELLEWREKPAPKYIPFDSNNAPKEFYARIKSEGLRASCLFSVSEINRGTVNFSIDYNGLVSVKTLLEDYEISTDLINWKVAGILVEE